MLQPGYKLVWQNYIMTAPAVWYFRDYVRVDGIYKRMLQAGCEATLTAEPAIEEGLFMDKEDIVA